MEERKNFIINVLFYGLIFGIIYLSVKYVLPVTSPFIIGFVFAYFALKICKYVFHNETKPYRGLGLALVYLIVIIIFTLLIVIGVDRISAFFSTMPAVYEKYIEPFLASLNGNISGAGSMLPEEASSVLNNLLSAILDSLESIVTSVSQVLVNATTTVIGAAPDLLIDVTCIIISSFYFAFDYEHISGFVHNFLDEKTNGIISEIKFFVENNLFKIIKSYLIIMGFTFCELLIGLTIIGTNNAAVVSFVITVLDIMPILGVGTVLIPWGIIDLFFGKILSGVEILVLYVIITFIRQIIEPKLVGGDLGLHPLTTLIAMIVGLDLFGLLGMFGIPLTLSFLSNRNDIKEKMVE